MMKAYQRHKEPTPLDNFNQLYEDEHRLAKISLGEVLYRSREIFDEMSDICLSFNQSLYALDKIKKEREIKQRQELPEIMYLPSELELEVAEATA